MIALWNRRIALCVLAALATAWPLVPAAAQTPASPTAEPATPKAASFRIVFDKALQPDAYSGRVYVVFSIRDRGEPRFQMGNWGDPAQMLAKDVSSLAVGGSVVMDGSAISFPKAWNDLDARDYRVQAVARRSLDSPKPGMGEGDLYSKPVAIVLDRAGAGAGAVELKLSEVVRARTFVESDRLRLVEIVSDKLSKFHHREVKIRASVYLPEGWKDDPKQIHPVLYSIPGFGGDHRDAGMGRMLARAEKPLDCLFVVPDPTCFYGHSVFADSDNSGPWGAALIEELIPAVEKKFHGAMSGEHRYVTGVSSGGWSCLWLQVTYPDEFAGCWSHCPDPVDFRDFQRINLYEPGVNIYHDGSGQRRPLARQGDRVTIFYDDFVRMESAIGPGGQIGSFEAVFGRRAKNGAPELVFDRATGAVNGAAAKHWEKYDIHLVTERNWKDLQPRLKGKLHIYAGEKDNFYLEGAVVLLKQSLEKLGSDAEVVVVPGMGHSLHRPGWDAMVETIRAASAP